MGVFKMYFDFLKDSITDWEDEETQPFNWNDAPSCFVRTLKLASETIRSQEARLAVTGYTFPDQLKAFWTEIGCGYLCSNFLADNGIEEPKAVLDIYFSEGEWGKVKTSFNLLSQDELPFFRTSDFNYITIGLDPCSNLGKIYLNGDEIAESLSDFIKAMLENPLYYQELALTL